MHDFSSTHLSTNTAVALFLLATLFFISVAIVSPAGTPSRIHCPPFPPFFITIKRQQRNQPIPGWTLGHIVTTSVLMPEAVPCPSSLRRDAANGDEECEASKIIVDDVRVNYGGFNICWAACEWAGSMGCFGDVSP